MTHKRSLLAPMLLAAALPSWASDTTAADVRQRYEAERARCLAGQSQQERDTCLREAGAARDEARRGGLATAPGALSGNAVARCDAQPPAERAACVARIQGTGKTQGSVESGGLIRQTETRLQ